ncbi:Ulp1 protease family protein [Abeliophyllum distichum]|uniref:Ulp1 protease family protein n=1 Tax=Abeliophyllum distichum TaxID=126358 RepID=A0ABD1Q7Q6_9LAMI
MSFEYTIGVLKRDMGDKLINSLRGGESYCRYSLHGFPLAIMIWAFEAIPSLEKKFAKKYVDGIPRMLAWEISKRLTSSAANNVLESKELEVKFTLIPTEVERISQPPPVYHDHNIADIVRMEMEKLVGRLLWFISKWLDHIEYKIDSLVELTVVGRFSSITSACESPICNTTNIHEAQLEVERKKKKNGLDDVMDELEKERIEDETGEDDLVPLRHSDVEAKCLLDLLNEDVWLTGESAHGELQIYAQSSRKQEFKFSKSLIKYVEGSTPEFGKLWRDCRYLYAPSYAIGSHWFAVKIDLEDRIIFIFDNLKSHVCKTELEAFMMPF